MSLPTENNNILGLKCSLGHWKDSKFVYGAVNNSCMLRVMLRIYCKYGPNPDLGLPFLCPKIYNQENGTYFNGSPAQHSAHLALQIMKFLRFWNCEGYLGFPESGIRVVGFGSTDASRSGFNLDSDNGTYPSHWSHGRDLPDILLV